MSLWTASELTEMVKIDVQSDVARSVGRCRARETRCRMFPQLVARRE